MSDAQTINPADAGKPINEHIRADRACIGCGFNLYGQTVSKDPHYGLAIARCPECGQVATLQSYPTMSRWVNRFRALLASLWVSILIVLLLISTIFTIEIAMSSMQLASDELTDHIGASHESWRLIKDREQAEAALANGVAPTVPSNTNQSNSYISTSNGLTSTTTSFPDGNTSTTINNVPMGVNYSGAYSWYNLSDDWLDQELEQSLAIIGGVWKNLDKDFLAMLLPASVLAFFFGNFWSITMLGAKRRTILWIPLLVLVFAATLLIWSVLVHGTNPRATDIANRLALPYVLPIIMGTQLIFAFLGVYLGRKIARFVICMSLPPRYRTSLSIFWTRDGLELPKPTLK